jgi:hypothetical protein
MAIEQGTETVAVTSEERTWRVEIFTDKGIDPLVRVHRQVIKSLADGTVLSIQDNAIVERLQSAVMNDSFTAAGVTVSGAALAALISQAADQWRAEDLAAPAPQEPQPPPEPEPFVPETPQEQP